MNFFINWLRENWNDQSDIVSFSKYQDVKSHYLNIINNEVDLSVLYEESNLFSAWDNMILLLVEKWLFAQSSILEPDEKRVFKNHFDARTALINRYLFNKENGFFYDYDVKNGKMVDEYKPIDQFFAYWLNLSSNINNAKTLLMRMDSKEPFLFVTFMGLRRVGLTKEANQIGEIIGYKIDNYNPNISTNTAPLLKDHSLNESLKLIREAGFSYFDHSMESVNEFFVSDNYLENAKQLRKSADKLGLICNQTHSIFPVWHKTLEKDEVKRRIEYSKRILEISKVLGAKNCVVHPINDFNEQENYEYFQQFLPLANKLDINIATENMWNWSGDKASLAACSNHDNFKALLDLVNDSHFTACLDIGHAEMDGLNTSAVKMIEALKDKLTCLHIHDNDCHHDRHGLPFTERIEFAVILDALARVNYLGDITFECDGFIYRMPKELHLSCLKIIYQIGLYLKSELLIRRKAICLKK